MWSAAAKTTRAGTDATFGPPPSSHRIGGMKVRAMVWASFPPLRPVTAVVRARFLSLVPTTPEDTLRALEAPTPTKPAATAWTSLRAGFFHGNLVPLAGSSLRRGDALEVGSRRRRKSTHVHARPRASCCGVRRSAFNTVKAERRTPQLRFYCKSGAADTTAPLLL